jgi:outer membrane immunogenic protein
MKFTLTSIALALSVGSAFAESVEAPLAEPAVIIASYPDTAWAGFYAGASLNVVNGAVEVNDFGSLSGDLEQDTPLGLHLGYNWQRGLLVYGAELNYMNLSTGFENNSSTRPQQVAELRGRVGFGASDVLVYGFVGYATSSLVGATTDVASSGMAFGGGVEYLVNDNFAVGLEASTREIGFSDADDSFDYSVNSLSLRTSYKF